MTAAHNCPFGSFAAICECEVTVVSACFRCRRELSFVTAPDSWCEHAQQVAEGKHPTGAWLVLDIREDGRA